MYLALLVLRGWSVDFERLFDNRNRRGVQSDLLGSAITAASVLFGELNALTHSLLLTMPIPLEHLFETQFRGSRVP